MNNTDKVRPWNVCYDVTTNTEHTNYAVVILNTPINFSVHPKFIINLWNNATVRVTVDGGTQRWLNWLRLNECEFPKIAAPDLITGDMDSLSKEVLQFFQKQNTQIVYTPDQNETDFTKALREVGKHCELHGKQVEHIYVFADTCGRFDQIMANINTLYKALDIVKDKNIIQIASTSFTWLMEPGKHLVSIPNSLRKNNEWCALIPIGKPCMVTTSGLKWNLENSKLEFGDMVSTSNTYSGTSRHVFVATDSPLIWSMGIDTLF